MRKLRHYTAIVLSYALIFSQTVPAIAYTDELMVQGEEVSVSEEAGALEEAALQPDGSGEAGLISEDEGMDDLFEDEDKVLAADELSDGELIEETVLTEAAPGAPLITEEASDGITADAEYAHTYDFNAALLDPEGGRYPGVYVVKPSASGNGVTIGIPSVASQNIVNKPTTESPAIITGAAVPYEKRTGPVDFTPISPDAKLYAPYSYFRYEKMDEAGPDGTIHTKLSGYDGTYYIIRVDVSDIIKDAPEGSFLHVKHDHNKALMVTIGMENEDGMASFCDAGGSKTASFGISFNQISGNQLVRKDKDGDFMTGSYVDVVLMSSGTLVQGADTGVESDPQAPLADFGLSFYIDKTGDYNPDVTWNSSLGSAVNTSDGKPVTITPEMKQAGITDMTILLDKFYDEKKATEAGAHISKYTVMGSDIEIDTMVENTGDSKTESGKAEYWSLKRAMEYQKYDNHALKLICESPLLYSMEIKGKSRKVVLDVNSFDIQLANHADKDAAAITVDGATLKVEDTSNTTGAELAVGNNARMEVKNGGRLIIAETSQLEVEYDASSVSVGEINVKDLTNGVMTVNSGGVIENRGVITIEGKEGKPQDAADAQTVVRDYRNAILTIDKGGTLENYGCMLVNGEFYNLGTVKNYGKYEDVIVSDDPDKGRFEYHRGIQLSWKDDITQGHTFAGEFYNGKSEQGDIVSTALLDNAGDIVMIPGFLENYAAVKNEGSMLMCAVDEVIIPIKAFADQPLVREQRVKLGYYENSVFDSMQGSKIDNSGTIGTAEIEITGNGRTGKIIKNVSDNLKGLNVRSYGPITNSGTIAVNALEALAPVTNKGNGVIDRIFICKDGGSIGKFTDSSSDKKSKVYNAANKAGGSTNTWTYAELDSLYISDDTRITEGKKPGETATWKVTVNTGNTGKDILYAVDVYSLIPYDMTGTHDVKANTETEIISPVLPDVSGNAVYYLDTDRISNEEYTSSDLAIVKVNGTGLQKPTAIQDLVYNGKDLKLVTPGSLDKGKVEYKLEGGTYSETIPSAKNAGTYNIAWRALDKDGNERTTGSLSANIAKRPAYISADDKAYKKGEPARSLTYISYGIAAGDNLGISITCPGLNTNTPGTYPIKTAYTASPNYDVTVFDGTYTVIDSELSGTPEITAQAVMSGFDNRESTISVNIVYTTGEDGKGAEIYYSLDDPLDGSNYDSKGSLAIPSYGGMGYTKMYYYVVTPKGSAGGCQPVVKIKADQEKPDVSKIKAMQPVKGESETITGLEVRRTEYRRVDEEEYAMAFSDTVNVIPGTYLVRYAGDVHYNPSEDVVIEMPVGKTVTASFETNGGSPVPDQAGLEFGDSVVRPADPTKEGYRFVDWFEDAECKNVYDFKDIITDEQESGLLTLYAGWARTIPDTTKEDNDEIDKDISDDVLSVNTVSEGSLRKNIVSISGNRISVVAKDEDDKVTVESRIWIGGLKDSYTYTGEQIKPEIHVYDGVKKLTEKTDYTLSYRNNKNAGLIGAAGGKSPTIIIKFKGNYKDNQPQSVEFNILPAVIGKDVAVNDVSVAALKNDKAQKPVPTIYMASTGKPLKAGLFEINYAAPVTKAGTYKVTVGKKDANFTGSKDAVIHVVKDKNLMLEKASVSIKPGAYVYTGRGIAPQIDAYTLKMGSKELEIFEDYEIEDVYNNVEPGTATVVFTAVSGNKAGYAGTKTATFKIKNGRALINTPRGDFKFVYDNTVTYSKSGAGPAVKVYDRGSLLKENVDYTLTYKDNKAQTGGEMSASVIVKGKGKYTDSVTLNYAIEKQNINALTVEASDLFTDAAKYKGKADIKITDKDGKKLSKKDYSVKAQPLSGNTVTAEVTGEGNYGGTRIVSFRLMDKSTNIAKAGILNPIPVQEYTGNEITLSRNDLKNVLFTGSKKAPKMLSYNNMPATDDYEIVGYSNNIKTGTAKVTVRGINGMAGTKTLTFKIRGKKTGFLGALIDGRWRK